MAVLMLAGCSSRGGEQTDRHEYLITAPQGQVFARAKETCAKVGRLISQASFQSESNIPDPPLKIECAAPYEVVPVSKDSYRIWGKDAYKIWVPTSEIPKTDPCPACVPSLPFGFSRLEVADERAKQRATEYCSAMNKTMRQTDGDFDIGTGLNIIFKCESIK